ncbi:hypothetical protein HYX11_03850 [Candidatus Woesearchaeota archaeon]|nr:hypothetical protein [Candidatus Woesearchaeota archaeon]
MIAKEIKIDWILLALLVLLIVIPIGYSLGITPPAEELNFESGLSKTFQLNIYGENKPFEVKLSVSGELKDYIKLKQEVLTVPLEGLTLYYKINLPSELKPGRHKASIIIEQQLTVSETGAGKSTFGAMPAVGHVIIINVPYEGKYAEAKLNAPDVKIGEVINFVVTVTNYGSEALSNVQGTIKIYDSEGKEIISIGTDDKEVKKGESVELYAHWTPNIKAGIYKAKVVVDYDNKKTEAETSFRIGDILVGIISLNPQEFVNGKINKMELEVESLWDSEIKNVYASIDIKKGKSKEETIATPPVTLKPWQKDKLIAYLDTTNYETGEYNAEVTLNYADKTTQKDFKLTVNNPRESKNTSKTYSTLTIPIIIVVIILIISTSIILIKKRREKEEELI